MQTYTAGQTPDFNSEEMKKVVHRLEAIGWIDKDKMNSVASGSVIIFYTPKGASLMPDLIALWKSVGSRFSSLPFDQAKIGEALEFGKRLGTLAPGLFLPPLTPGELKALGELMDGFDPRDVRGMGHKRPS